jgi:hypothetical protein
LATACWLRGVRRQSGMRTSMPRLWTKPMKRGIT